MRKSPSLLELCIFSHFATKESFPIFRYQDDISSVITDAWRQFYKPGYLEKHTFWEKNYQEARQFEKVSNFTLLL